MVSLLLYVSPRTAVATAVLPAAVLLLTAPTTAAVAAVGLLPLAPDLLGGGPVRLSIPDVLLLLAVVGTAAAGLRFGAATTLRVPVGLYAGVLAVAVASHPDLGALVNAGQRLQIVLMSLIVGAVVLDEKAREVALSMYVMTATLLGLAWTAKIVPEALAFQKNPVGQYLAGALLVLLATPGHRGRLVAVVPLSIGLLSTESRGAIMGLVVGMMLLVLGRPGMSRLRGAATLVPFVLLLGAVFATLPDEVQQRTTTLSASDSSAATSGQYTIKIREEYRNDALEVVRDHPILGVGIGNYLTGDPEKGTLTDDPHNVLLLEAAEGGLPLAASFSLLLVGSGVACWRRRRLTPLAALALAVQGATVAHGLLDVYWVRGTPVLGWILVGAALADAQRRRS
jgi:hypothetical protein